MDVHLSIKAKLVVSAEAKRELKSTMEEFNRACNILSEMAFQQNLRRKYREVGGITSPAGFGGQIYHTKGAVRF